MNLSTREFHLIKNLVYDKFGIHLGEHKKSLVVQRLQKELWNGGFSSFKEYYDYVTQDSSGQALRILGDLISTNHTYFFREEAHFEFLKSTVLPQLTASLQDRGEKELRIWCAGCSSGEEPYSLAMILSDYDVECSPGIESYILATDIAATALRKAVAGVYAKDQVSRVPLLYRMRYLENLYDGQWMVKEKIRKKVLFRRLNLMRREYPFKKCFQIIFCRNVMIYFDESTRNQMTARFSRYLEPGGYLFIGHSETLDRSSGLYQFIQPAVYQRE
ncbi:MAG TPA: protein-glutamate O-methyltransferase CheR [Syntrophomonadaceae bacterium]|nr:protein-glutamate O-methyltransferase CheR [Syntrophomonadaceae bacterium]